MTRHRLLDTCVISRYLAPDAKRRSPALVERVDRVLAADGLRLSIVTAYELDRGFRVLAQRAEGAAKQRQFSMFMSEATVFSLDESAWAGWQQAAELYAEGAQHRPAVVIAEADRLILATAIAHGMVLLTADAPLVKRCQDLQRSDDVELVEYR
jgi:predicted nucleic acid-binding protein